MSMDKLITHLERTLDEDESVQEALLLLKNLDGIPMPLDSKTYARQDALSKEFIFDGENTCGVSRKNINQQLVAMHGLTSFLSSKFYNQSELPLKIVAFRMGIAYDELLSICGSINEDKQDLDFAECCLTIIDCFETDQKSRCALENIDNIHRDALDKAERLKIELSELRDISHKLEDYIRSNIGEYIQKHAIPMPLGSLTDQTMDTQEVPLLFQDVQQLNGVKNETVSDLLYSSVKLEPHDLPVHSVHHQDHTNESIPTIPAAPLTASTDGSERMHVLYKLAPLVEAQRSSKHFIVPLLEPDLLYGYKATFVPSLHNLGIVNCSISANNAKDDDSHSVDTFNGIR